ncbi:MAG: hypothetical protein QOI80_3615 [Solirubrobacteraceae bacterium]|jgi:hypothetical protein|nr:hypothetical protein [Solirubrobacteraceae bacterium]
MKILPKALCALLLAGLAVGAIVGQSGAAGGYGTDGTKLEISVPGGQTPQGARKHGLKVDATCNVTCTVKLKAVKGGKQIGSGSKALPKKTGTVKVHFNKKTRKALKHAKKFKFKVTGQATGAGNVKSDVQTVNVKLTK